ncbi:hypothetical protein D3C76_1598730 [compost metagenome]
MFFPLWNDVLRSADFKGNMVHPVKFSVDTGIFNRFLYDFDAIHPLGMLREEKGDRPDAAVGINDSLLSGQARVFDGFAVKHFCLYRIHLIKRTC